MKNLQAVSLASRIMMIKMQAVLQVACRMMSAPTSFQ